MFSDAARSGIVANDAISALGVQRVVYELPQTTR